MKAIPKKIAVLMGGPGSERDVSMATGKGVAKALRSLGAEVAEVDVKGADFELPGGIEMAFIALDEDTVGTIDLGSDEAEEIDHRAE